MEITIEEIITKETKLAQEFQDIIDTHMITDNLSLEELYYDNTEVIEEQLQRCKVFADYHNQIANTMRKYQKIKQIIEANKYQPANTYVCGGVWLTDEKRVSAIREVIKDGKIKD